MAVILWGIALATSLAPSQRPELPLPPDPPRAQLQAVPVEPPAPETPPAPAEPTPKPASSPAVEVTSADLARGADLLASGGRFPVISASYEGLRTFGRYAAAMTSIGGRFVVVSHRKIVGEVDLADGTIRAALLDRPFSPRARDYTDEPALAEPARRVRERFGPDAEIMLLVPRAVDAGLFGGIARELADGGEGHAGYREVEGRYERAPGGGLRFRLLSGLRMDGGRVALGAVFDLDAIAASGSSG